MRERKPLTKEQIRDNIRKMFRQDGKENTPEEIKQGLNKSLKILGEK